MPSAFEYHKDITGVDLHIPKTHASSHASGGTDPITLAEIITLEQISDVTLASLTNNDLLYYDGTTSLWKNTSTPTLDGSNITNIDGQNIPFSQSGFSATNLNDAVEELLTTRMDAFDLPHLMQSDSTDQAIINISNAQVITFDTDVHHYNIARTSSSRFTSTKTGSYLITFSGIAVGATSKTLQVWLRVNDVDVPNSNTIYFFKTTGVGGLVAVSFIQYLAVGSYFEFWTWGGAVTSTWKATAAGSTPTRPACPSIIITANYVGTD